MKEKYKILIEEFLDNEVDPLWQYPNSRIKEMDSKSVTIEATSPCAIQRFKFTDSTHDVIINWHIILTIDPSIVKSVTNEITWRFPSDGNQNEMLKIIYQDIESMANKNEFTAFL